MAVDNNIKKVDLEFHHGIRYQEAWDMQTAYHNTLKDQKLRERGLDEDQKSPILHKIFLCEHYPVYTLGKSGSVDHLLLNERQLSEQSIEYFPINRGGDITYHGPGQITGYPIFNLDDFYHDVRRYVYDLEEVIIRTIASYDLIGKRIEGYTGVWLGEEAPYRKICAIGVHLSRWVTLHGFALNVNTDLDYFKNIIPCGIVDEDKTVTSISEEFGSDIDMEEVIDLLSKNFESIFNLSITRLK